MTKTELVMRSLGLEVLRRSGTRAWCKCPYHGSERNAPFFVRTAGKRAGENHCFSCKKGGTLTQLVMHLRKLDEDKAAAFIEKAVRGFEPPKVRARVVASAPRMVRARFTMPREIIAAPMSEWIDQAREYAEGRGIDASEVDLFRIGYAVDGRLAGRLVLPWLDAHGRPQGYSARTFVGDEPKYQTPFESDGADRATMFGEHLWPAIGERRIVVVTEGALNALAVRRSTLLPVAALGGSEIEPLQIVKLATFPIVIILTDPDEAGDKAASVLSRQLGRSSRTARGKVPPGLDALDVQLRCGAFALAEIIRKALRSAGLSNMLRTSCDT